MKLNKLEKVLAWVILISNLILMVFMYQYVKLALTDLLDTALEGNLLMFLYGLFLLVIIDLLPFGFIMFEVVFSGGIGLLIFNKLDKMFYWVLKVLSVFLFLFYMSNAFIYANQYDQGNATIFFILMALKDALAFLLLLGLHLPEKDKMLVDGKKPSLKEYYKNQSQWAHAHGFPKLRGFEIASSIVQLLFWGTMFYTGLSGAPEVSVMGAMLFLLALAYMIRLLLFYNKHTTFPLIYIGFRFMMELLILTLAASSGTVGVFVFIIVCLLPWSVYWFCCVLSYQKAIKQGNGLVN